MKQSEYLSFDATALADLIRRGDVSAREVAKAAIDRANRVNGKLNAICHPQFTEAMEQGFPEDGPFAGVPFTTVLLLRDGGSRFCRPGRGCVEEFARPSGRRFGGEEGPARPSWLFHSLILLGEPKGRPPPFLPVRGNVTGATPLLFGLGGGRRARCAVAAPSSFRKADELSRSAILFC